MTGKRAIDCGRRSLLEFRGPDAVRYLNGQVTQDVRKVMEAKVSLPACVTDAKGKIQHRVWLCGGEAEESILVDAPEGAGEFLMERLTKYLIADEVEVEDLSGSKRLVHLLEGDPPRGPLSRRFGMEGVDCWLAGDTNETIPEGFECLDGDELEALRIGQRIPKEGIEPIEGSFPAELGLDTTDVSFQKGCYIGQEVISRIQTVKKVNRRLCQLRTDAGFKPGPWSLETSDGKEAGVVTSISPIPDGNFRLMLAMVRRGREPAFVVFNGQKASVGSVE